VAEAIEPEPEPEPEPLGEIQERKQGFLARWLFRRRQPEPEPVVEPEPVAIEPDPPVEPAPEPVATAETEHVQRILEGTLEALGQAHHRPFSRG
jgi:hypothetical protein